MVLHSSSKLWPGQMHRILHCLFVSSPLQLFQCQKPPDFVPRCLVFVPSAISLDSIARHTENPVVLLAVAPTVGPTAATCASSSAGLAARARPLELEVVPLFGCNRLTPN